MKNFAKMKEVVLRCDSMKTLILKTILYLAIPYAYLILCGIVFDSLLKWYFMTTFIFFSLIALYIVAFVVIILVISKYVKKGKKK